MTSLTRYPAASFRELSSITFPLILSFASQCLMLFADRLILARYSIDAMNGMVAAFMVVALFLYGAVGIASIAEVFVGRHYGASEPKKTGSATWQMIWFSLFTLLVFLPLSIFSPLFFPHPTLGELSTQYARPLFLMAPLFPPRFPLGLP